MTAATASRMPIDWFSPTVDSGAMLRWSRLAGAVMLGYLIVRAPALLAAPTTWEPVGALRPLGSPLPRPILAIVWAAGLLGSASLLVGRFLRPASLALCTAALILFTHRSSGGQILWFDVLPTLHILALAAGLLLQPPNRVDARLAGWALRLASLMTVATYVVAGVAKLRIGGLGWIADGVLERHITYSAMRLDVLGGTASPLAAPLVDLGIASAPLAVAVILIELGAPVALVNRRWAMAWAAAAWLMHAVIAATMFVVFHWPLFGVAFLPLILVFADQDSPEARRSA